jgi:hypothetical protein
MPGLLADVHAWGHLSALVAIWLRCQQDALLLVTANRNDERPDALETVIREGGKDSLPVLTLANPRRIIRDRAYAELAAIRLMEILFDVELLRGSGRLYLP